MDDFLMLAARIQALGPDERAILAILLDRMELGRKQYGPWDVNDGRHYPSETLAEVIDALHYSAAELVRLGRREA